MSKNEVCQKKNFFVEELSTAGQRHPVDDPLVVQVGST